MNLLTVLFVVGTTVFAVSTVVALVAGVWLWWWQRRENPAHLVIFASFAAMLMYASLWTDYNFHLRTSDGVEVPWLRNVFQIALLVFYSHMDIETVWLSWWRQWTYVGLNALIGALLLIADIAGPEHWRGWYAWVVAVVMAIVVHSVAFWHMRRNDWSAFFSKLGWAAYVIVALPLTQALSYTMGQVLNKSPDRGTTEIIYLIITGVWVIIYGFVVMFSYQPIPRQKLAPRKQQ